MQQEQQHSEQRYPSAAQHPIGEHAAGKAARYKEQVCEQVARQVDVAAVYVLQSNQSERALSQQQRHLKSHAVVAI